VVTAVVMFAGGLAGAGVFWWGWQALARVPAARPALRRLHPEGVGARLPLTATGRWGVRLVARWWRPPQRELALLGRSTGQYVTSLAASAVVGFAAVVVLAVLVALGGVAAPLPVPAGVALAAAAVAAWGAHQDVMARAGRARYEFRRAVCSYLDLVALELAAGHGPVAALERGCAGIDGWVFARLRETLMRAQLQLRQPWDELRAMAAAIGVPELGDVGEIVQAAGADGAVVHDTLLARAGSLRDQIRVEALARAKAVTTKLDIPGALLLLLLAVYTLYPLLARFAT
jgi:Flp pilus assembly protein TadB